MEISTQGQAILLDEDGQIGMKRTDIEIEKNKDIKTKSYYGSSQEGCFNLTL